MEDTLMIAEKLVFLKGAEDSGLSVPMEHLKLMNEFHL